MSLHLEWLAIPLELALVLYVGRRVVLARRHQALHGGSGRAAADLLERLRAILSEALPFPRLGEVVADEMATLYYGLFSWWRREEEPGPDVFSYHRKSGYGAVLGALLMVCAFEALGVHFLLQRWSPAAAWIFTILTLYGMIWMVGDARAQRLRPILLADGVLHVRIGLRWTLPVPLAAVAEVADARTVRPPLPRRAPEYLRATVLGAPQLLLVLREPLTAQGPYGIRRTATRVGLGVDEPDRLRAALVEALEGHKALTGFPADARVPPLNRPSAGQEPV